MNTTAWEIDGFACADGWDEEKKRYRGLKAAKPVTVSVNVEALIVKPEVARAQMDAKQPVGPIGPVGPGPGPRRGTGLQGPGGPARSPGK